jgi:hypothetical protein
MTILDAECCNAEYKYAESHEQARVAGIDQLANFLPPIVAASDALGNF